MRRGNRSRIAVSVGIFALGVVLGLTVSGAAAQTIVKMGMTSAPDQPETLAAKEFAKMVGDRTKGGVRVDILAAGTGGGEREIAEGMQLGTMHMGIVSGILQNFDPAMMILEYEFLFKNEDHIRAVWYGPVGERIKKRLLDRSGIRVHSVLMRTPRLLTTNKPVNSLEDLKGMKIRVPEMAARVALWRALGARPTPMAAPEILTGLKLGTIDGQENPAALIFTRKYYEVVKYLAQTNHVYGFMLMVSSDKFFNQLPKGTQEIFQQAAVEAGRWNDECVKKTESDFMEKLSRVMTFTKPDIRPWREATKDVYKKFSNVEGFMDLHQAIVEEGKRF